MDGVSANARTIQKQTSALFHGSRGWVAPLAEGESTSKSSLFVVNYTATKQSALIVIPL